MNSTSRRSDGSSTEDTPQRPGHAPGRARPVSGGEIALPNPQHPPARFAQDPRHRSIPGLVPGQLGRPPAGPGRGLRRMFRTTVPETAIHEDGSALAASAKLSTGPLVT